MSVEEQLRQLGGALDQAVKGDYGRVLRAYRRRAIRKRVAVGAGVAIAATGVVGGVLIAGGDQERRLPQTREPKLAITVQATLTTVQPAGLEAHYLVLNPSTAILPTGSASRCVGIVRDPLVDGSTLRLRSLSNPDPSCQEATNRMSADPQWRPMLLTFNSDVFDVVDRVSVSEPGSHQTMLTPVERQAVDVRHLPSVVTGTVDAVGATATTVLSYEVDQGRPRHQAQGRTAVHAGKYALVIGFPHVRATSYLLQAVAPGGPCGAEPTRVRPAESVTVNLTCETPAATDLHGLSQVWPTPVRPLAGQRTRVEISGSATGAGLAPLRIDFGDGSVRSHRRQPRCIGGQPTTGQHGWLTRFSHRWSQPGNYRITVRLAHPCDRRIPVHEATFTLHIADLNAKG